MVEEKPALGCLNWDRACTYLHALPCALLEGSRSHDVAVVPPVFQIRGFGIEYIPECRVAGIARAGKQGELAIDFPREEDSVPVIRQEGVLQLVEGLEIIRPGKADGRAVVAVAPGHIEPAFNLSHSRVISVNPFSHLRVSTLEADGLGIDVPIESVP